MRFLNIAFFASVVVFLFAVFFHSVIEFDQDLGRHLLMGEIISNTFSVPKNNLLSFTHPNFQFVNSHWLSEVIFFQVYQLFNGATSLLYLKVLMLTAAFLLTVYSTYRQSKNLIATAISFAFFAPILLERTEIRPEIFSYLFTALFVYILTTGSLFDKKHSRKLLWLLPITQLLWVNLHIYFIIGPILMGLFLLDKFWQAYKRDKNFSKILMSCRFEIFITVLIFIASLINPNFLVGAIYPLRVFDNYGYSIVENQNVFFLKDIVFNPNISFFFICFVAFIGSFVITDWKKIKFHSLLIAGLTILPFTAIRSFPFFFLLELPVIAFNLANLNPVFSKWLSLNFLRIRLGTKFKIIVISLVILLTFWRSTRLITNEYYRSIDSHKRFGISIAESGKGAIDFVLKNNLHGPIFNNFDMGSYISYRLYPKEKVFVDGRPEAYPAQFFQGVYIPMQMTSENFKSADEIYKFNLIVFSHTDATPWAQNFLSIIIKNPDFSLVYLDPYSVVFVKNKTYPEIANRFAFTYGAKIGGDMTNNMTNSYLSDLSAAQVYSTFGWNDLAFKSVQKAYAKNSNSIGALSALSVFYSTSPTSIFLAENYSKLLKQKTGLVFF